MRFLDQNLTVGGIQTGDATIVALEFSDTHKGYAMPLVSGTAKRSPDDSHDSVTGERLATARALEKLARKLRKSVRRRASQLPEAVHPTKDLNIMEWLESLFSPGKPTE